MTTTTGTKSTLETLETATSTAPATFNETGKTKYGTKNYEVLIGYIKDGELPQYVVRNLETGVVEFNHEVLSFVREWIAHFQARLDALDEGRNPDEQNGAAHRVANFN